VTGVQTCALPIYGPTANVGRGVSCAGLRDPVDGACGCDGVGHGAAAVAGVAPPECHQLLPVSAAFEHGWDMQPVCGSGNHSNRCDGEPADAHIYGIDCV